MVKMGTINRLKQKLIVKYGCFDWAGDDVVLISGSGRSGTSWLANICNYKNDFRYIFEPLNPKKLRTKKNKWALSVDDSSSQMQSMLNGQVSNSWVNSRNRKLFAKRRLIKEIRTNLMLDWIINKSPNTKIIVIIRNPLAVAASRKSLDQRNDGSDWQWLPSLKQLLNEPILKSILKVDEYEFLSDQVGKGIVMETVADWCINNLIAFELIDRTQVKFVYYEELLSNSSEKVKEILDFIEVSIDSDINNAISQHSETARPTTSISTAKYNPLVQWQSILTEEEVDRATQLLVKC